MASFINARAFAPLTRTLYRRTVAPMNRSISTEARKFDWEDPLLLKEHLNEEEVAVSETARDYCQEKLLPRVTGACTLLPD